MIVRDVSVETRKKRSSLPSGQLTKVCLDVLLTNYYSDVSSDIR